MPWFVSLYELQFSSESKSDQDSNRLSPNYEIKKRHEEMSEDL